MAAQRRLLILRASTDVPKSEIDNIASHAKLYGIKAIKADATTEVALLKALNENSNINYIYLATHGCEDYLGDISGTVRIKWEDFATMICESDVLGKHTIFMHSCCRGGLNQVAWKMFETCERIEVVCGPRSNVAVAELITAFTLFMFNIEKRGVDPVAAARKVENATDVRLVCFDRVEEVKTYGYYHFIQEENARKLRELNTEEIINRPVQLPNSLPAEWIPPEVVELRKKLEYNGK